MKTQDDILYYVYCLLNENVQLHCFITSICKDLSEDEITEMRILINRIHMLAIACEMIWEGEY